MIPAGLNDLKVLGIKALAVARISPEAPPANGSMSSGFIPDGIADNPPAVADRVGSMKPGGGAEDGAA